MTVAYAGTDQRVVDEDQPFGQGHPDVILELDRAGTGPAFGAVDNDEIRTRITFDHGLADRQELPFGPDTQFEPDGFAAAELT